MRLLVIKNPPLSKTKTPCLSHNYPEPYYKTHVWPQNLSSKWTLRSRNEMNFNGPLNTAARLIRAVCLRGKIVHQSSFNLWFILQMYIRSSKRSSVPNDLGEKTCRALSLCRIPDTSLNGRRLSNQFLLFFFLGNLTDQRADVHHLLYDTTSLSKQGKILSEIICKAYITNVNFFLL